MKIGFLTNHISYGGTEVALYDYADFNEILLRNTSIVITRDYRSTHTEIYEKFEKRFPVFYIAKPDDIDRVVIDEQLDCLYVIKSGEVDWFYTTKCKTIIHCVFTTLQPHGTRYCAISDSLNKLYGTNVPVLPHMVRIENNKESYQNELSIPEDAIVIGRYGSYDSFDIPFVYSAIVELLERHPNMYFLCMNTKQFAVHPRIIYLPRTTCLRVKRKFINTCNVMLHARTRGETFGLSCGEFAVCSKPILTYSQSQEKAHIEILGNQCIQYTTKEDILSIFENERWRIDMTDNGYLQFTPENVMMIFDRITKNV